jgi:glucose dehydrogenase
VAHEGAHAVDGPVVTPWQIGSPSFGSYLSTETHAYEAEAAVDQGLGVISASDGTRPVWNPAWGAAAAELSGKAIKDNAYSNAVVDCDRAGGCSGQPKK